MVQSPSVCGYYTRGGNGTAASNINDVSSVISQLQKTSLLDFLGLECSIVSDFLKDGSPNTARSLPILPRFVSVKTP
jgi:hypothetical protein